MNKAQKYLIDNDLADVRLKTEGSKVPETDMLIHTYLSDALMDFLNKELKILTKGSTEDKQSEQKNLCINYNDCRYSKKYPAYCINSTKHHCYRA